MVFCGNCGKRFLYKEKFCTSCGTELEKISEIAREVGEIIKNEYRKQLSNPEHKEIKAEVAESKNKPVQTASNELQSYWQIIDSLRAELIQYKSKLDAMTAERSRQDNVDLLRQEVIQYKSKLDTMTAERSRQDNVDLLRQEVIQYKSKLDTMTAERSRQDNVDLLKREIAEFKNSGPRTLPSGDDVNKRIIHSLGTDIEKLRKNLELVMVEAEKLQ